jgi:hypothetical protein
MLDIRGLSEGSTRLPVPAWVPPEDWDWNRGAPNDHRGFIRGFGAVERRRRGGLLGWPREDIYVSARRAIRLDLPTPEGRRSFPVRCVVRRIFFDGHAIARLDIGLDVGFLPDDIYGQYQGTTGLIRALNTKAILTEPRRERRQHTLWRIGPPMAHLYQTATQHAGAALDPQLKDARAVLACEPIVIIESVSDTPPIGDDIWLGDNKNIRLEASRVRVARNAVLPAWIITIPHNSAERRDRRLLRVALVRQHAERTALLRLTRHLESSQGPSVQLSPEKVYRFVEKRMDLMTRRSLHGFPQRQIVQVAWDSLDRESDESLATTFARLTQLDDRIGTLTARLAQRIAEHGSSTWSITHIERAFIMTEEVKSITLGSNNTISAPIVLADKIENSFNAVASMPDSDLKSALENLHRSIAEWSKSLDKTTAEDVATDLEALTNEAQREEPRPSRIKDFLESIKSVAESVADNAGPVLAALGAIAGAFGFGA